MPSFPTTIPLRVPCEIVVPTARGASERYWRLTAGVRPDEPCEIDLWRALPLEPGRRVEIALDVPGVGPIHALAVLRAAGAASTETDEEARSTRSHVLSLRDAGAPVEIRRAFARYAELRTEALAAPPGD